MKVIKGIVLFCLIIIFSLPSFICAEEKPEIFVQVGHSGFVFSLAFSPDGKYALSGSIDKTLKLWDISTGLEIRTFKGHADRVNSVAFSPDGKYALSGSQDKTLKLWDVATGREIRTFRGHSSWIYSVSFSPDGKYALSGSGDWKTVSGSEDKTLKLWNISTGREIRSFRGHSMRVNSVAFSPDGKHVLSGSEDKTLKLWNISTGREIRTFRGHSLGVNSVAFSPDGKYALSGSGDLTIAHVNNKDNTLKLWDISTGREISTFGGHSMRVSSVAFSPDGKYALSGGGDLITLSGMKDSTLSPRSKSALSGVGDSSTDSTLKLWDISTGREISTFKGYTDMINSVTFSPDGKYTLSVGSAPTPKLLEISTGREIWTNKGDAYAINSIAISPDGRNALSGSWDKTLTLWDISTGRKIRTFKGHAGSVNSVVFSPNGRFALSGSIDKTLKLWDISTGLEIRTFRGHSSTINSVVFSPDGKYALSASGDWRTANGSKDRILKLWDIATGQEIRTFKGHVDNVDFVAFSPDGNYALSSGGDLKLWEISTGREIGTVSDYLGSVISLSPDGRYLLSGIWDKTLKLRDMTTGQEIRTFKGHSESVESIVFSPDGKYALSGSEDKTLKLWDIATGQEIKTFKGHGDNVSSVAFSPDGNYALSGSRDLTIRLWDIVTGKEIVKMVSFTDGEWVIMTPEGFYNSSPGGGKHINVRIGNKVYSVENFRRKFFRPEMVELALAGKSVPDPETIETVIAQKPAPSVLIISPNDEMVTSDDTAEVQVKIKDNGGGIGDIYVYVNDSLVSTDTRALKIKHKDRSRTMSFNVALSQGKNRIRVIAYNKDNSMSSHPGSIIITSDYKFDAPILYVLAVGIDAYENDGLNLKYAVADANLFTGALKNVSGLLFKDVKVISLNSSEETTKQRISETFEKLSNQIKANDYFIFYNSSHGYIATFNNGDSKYFLVTSNVIFLDPDNLNKHAISQDELIKLIGSIPAQNKILVLDTCQSGEAGRVIQIAMAETQKIYTRALSSATAMALIKMAVGSSVFTASQSIEDAIEGYKGHGLFTYTLVEGIKGSADENRDKFVTLSELKGYVERNVFLRSKKHFKRKQVPYINIGTLDFSIAQVN